MYAEGLQLLAVTQGILAHLSSTLKGAWHVKSCDVTVADWLLESTALGLL